MDKFKKIPFDQNTLTELTPEQIEAAKREYKGVYLITAGDKKIYLHKPDRQTIDLATISGRQKPSLFEETILRNCWLAGNKEVFDDVDLFYSVKENIGDIVEIKSAELTKL
ncbi:MAG: hypothetical protein IJC16_00185 [Rikenellaceae bacterium]|nr:hypothetical protein [Rikenellaceae bacterium]